MNIQYLVPLQLGLICVIALVIPLHAFLSDNNIESTCNIFICFFSGLLIMGLWMIWGHYIIEGFYKRDE